MNRPATPPEDGSWPRPVLAIAAGAIALRLLLFLGRGDYLAFDEGWYLLLGRSLFTGDGYTLIGTPHVTLSPLFPLLAGLAGAALDSWVWGGRVVAALASGLLVLPAWAIFRRLASRRVAGVGALLVAVIPSMAPFVVPFWIGADLWVGAEPLLHCLLYSAIAVWMAADEKGGWPRWTGAGALFGLAFLARPEAVLVWGLLGLFVLGIALLRKSPRRLGGALLLGLGFVVVASPYWLYIQDVTGRWSLTGRVVAPVAAPASGERTAGAGGIERMLWEDDEAYERYLYGLDGTGLRLQSDYWGVPAEPAGSSTAAARPRGPGSARDRVPDASPAPVEAAPALPEAEAARPPPSPFALYGRSMRQILPLLLWLFVILGVVRPRGRGVLRRELPVAGALVGASVAIAVVVAVDPRTQLFVVPLLALYAARGFALIGEVVSEQAGGDALRPGFLEMVLAGAAVAWMLGIHGQRLYRSLAYGSPHHVVAEQNRHVAEWLDTVGDVPSGPVASWHPAIAVYADRDWRVLPYARLAEIVPYAAASGTEVLVLSAYYPPPLGVERLGTRYLVLPVPRPAPRGGNWSVLIERGDSIRAFGKLVRPPASSR